MEGGGWSGVGWCRTGARRPVKRQKGSDGAWTGWKPWKWAVLRDVLDGFRVCGTVAVWEVAPLANAAVTYGCLGVLLAACEWKDPGPLIHLVPAEPSPSMMAAPFSRVYGVPLGAHLQELGRDIALPIEACVLMLLSEGVKEEVGPTGAGGVEQRGHILSQTSPCCCCARHLP